MEILSSPLWSDYTFRVVLAGTTILGILCGVLGSFIVLRREALLGDGIAHSSYPGIMLAFMFLGVKSLDGLLLGAFISALVATTIVFPWDCISFKRVTMTFSVWASTPLKGSSKR